MEKTTTSLQPPSVPVPYHFCDEQKPDPVRPGPQLKPAMTLGVSGALQQEARPARERPGFASTGRLAAP